MSTPLICFKMATPCFRMQNWRNQRQWNQYYTTEHYKVFHLQRVWYSVLIICYKCCVAVIVQSKSITDWKVDWFFTSKKMIYGNIQKCVEVIVSRGIRWGGLFCSFSGKNATKFVKTDNCWNFKSSSVTLNLTDEKTFYSKHFLQAGMYFMKKTGDIQSLNSSNLSSHPSICDILNDSFPAKICIVVVLSVILLCSLAGNLFIAAIVYKRKELRKTINLFIVNWRSPTSHIL